jgi:hypothetical protein
MKKPIDPMELARRKFFSDALNKFEDLIQMVKQYDQGLNLLFSTLCNIHDPIKKIVTHASISKQDEFEAFIGINILNKVNIHLPNDIKLKERCKRIKKSKEMKTTSKEKNKHTCNKCKQVGQHDARNYANNIVGNV